MKRLLQIIFVTIMCFSLFSCFTVKADESKLTLENIRVGEKSTAVGINKLKLVNTDVTNDMFFNKVGDYITYNVVIRNTSDKDFIIKEINDDNENEYIKYDYLNYQDKVVAAGSEATVNVKATYSKKSSNKVISASAVNFNVLYESYSGNHNANTVDKIIIYISLFMLSVLGFILTFSFNKKHMATYLIIVLGIGVLLPYGVRAKSGVISFKVNNNITENSVSFLKTGKEVGLAMVTTASGRSLHWVSERHSDFYSLFSTDYQDDNIDEIAGEVYWDYIYYGEDCCESIVIASEEQYNAVKNTLNASNIISINESLIPTYYWVNNMVIYIYSEADTIMMNEDSSYLFSNLRGVSSIDLTKFNTSNVTNMMAMFYEATEVESFDLSNFDTSKVTNMVNMFTRCTNLRSFDFGDMDISNVTRLSNMFFYCYSLESFSFGNADTSSVKDVSDMFYYCEKLSSINLSSFNTSNVENMSGLFGECYSLTSINLSRFDTSKVTNMSSMFSDCVKITSLDVSHFDTSKVKNMSSMFSGCCRLASLDVSHFDTSNVTNMSGMFSFDYYDELANDYEGGYIYSPITSLDVSHFNTSKVTNMSFMFKGNYNLLNLDLSHFDTRNVVEMEYMFSRCSNLSFLDVSHFDTSKVTDMSFMFCDCNKLTSLDVSHFNTSLVEYFDYMFSNCNSLTMLDVSHFDTSKGVFLYDMFANCENITFLDVSNFSAISAEDISNMFYGCSKITSLDLSNFSIDSNVLYSMYGLFGNCELLETIYVTELDLSSLDEYSGLFDGCVSLVGGAGTVYDENNILIDYAKIDGGPSSPGYFTLKA